MEEENHWVPHYVPGNFGKCMEWYKVDHGFWISAINFQNNTFLKINLLHHNLQTLYHFLIQRMMSQMVNPALQVVMRMVKALTVMMTALNGKGTHFTAITKLHIP
jgi:hypothetical protein